VFLELGESYMAYEADNIVNTNNSGEMNYYFGFIQAFKISEFHKQAPRPPPTHAKTHTYTHTHTHTHTHTRARNLRS